MRTTPQSPHSRFPKGQPRKSGNHAPNPHPPPPRTPHRPSRTPPRASFLRRQESRGARRGAPPPKPPSLPRLPKPRRGGSRTARPAAAGPSPLRHHQPLPTPTPPIVLPALPHERHSCEGRNPEGRGAGRLRPPSHPPLPVVGAVCEPPLPPQRDPHPTASINPRRPPHPPSSFPRKPGPRAGARRGGVSVSRHSQLPNSPS